MKEAQKGVRYYKSVTYAIGNEVLLKTGIESIPGYLRRYVVSLLRMVWPILEEGSSSDKADKMT